MPVWEILELAEYEDAEQHLRSWFIEVPRGKPLEQYSHRELFTIDIKGWVIGRHARATAVELVYHGHVVRTDPVRGPREDIAPAFPDVDPGLDMHFHAMMGSSGSDRSSSWTSRRCSRTGCACRWCTSVRATSR